MGVVKREGKWRLVKERDGLYSIQKRDRKVAEIITDDFKGRSMRMKTTMGPTIEASDPSDAKRKFKNYIEKQEKNPIGL